MPKRTTIVTAIPYVNATPHIGTVLTDLAGDITARYHRMRGEDVFFVAGTDENGLKIKEAAEAAGRDPHEFVAEIAGRFESIFREMEIDFDDFVRTTQKRHLETTQHFFRVLQERGYIYSGTYEGWYDVSTETFFKESELVDGKSPDGNPVRWVSEENYFFKLSAFEKPLLDHIEANPGFIVPESRRNEVLSFIKQGLRDMAISRQNTGWGIPVPGNDRQVVYVWFDALINYVTATGWPADGWEDKWPPIVQWIGKDILTRFHATLWPAMLMGVGLPLPEVVAAHAWFLLGGGEKISKSKGNQVAPLDLAKRISERSGCRYAIAVDVVRHYLASAMPFENDAVFTYEEFDRKYNSDLANDLGNALNRSLAMVHKFSGGVIPEAEPEPAALEAIELAKLGYEAAMQGFRIERASDTALGLVRFLNKYIDTRAPWSLAKTNDPALAGVLRSMLLTIRAAEGLIRSEMPAAADQMAAQLGLSPLKNWHEIGRPASLPPGRPIAQPSPIFPRLDPKVGIGGHDIAQGPLIRSNAADESSKQTPAKEQKKVTDTPPTSEIAIDEFAKVQLKVGRVLEAEPLEGADKLLKLQVVIGTEQRQIVAGIRKSYSPEDLIGRQVIVVANLKPAKLRGIESQGMLLAAVDADGAAILLQPDRETPEGAQVR
jgi:methionyl-tRNA synthetase